MAVLVAATLAAGCRGAPPREGEAAFYTLPASEAAERHCAWYGDAADGVLYFGIAPFWAAYRESGGDPSADLRQPGPLQVGRFDLRRRAHLAPLPVGADSPTGVWDVLALEDGVYFTTLFGPAGVVDPRSGAHRRFPEAGLGLNELATGPDGSLLATRYFGSAGESGAVVQLDREGRVLAEHRLDAPEGTLAAPKSVAYDPLRREIWVNTDLLSVQGLPARHDARVLDLAGHELLRLEQPELQFVDFAPDGTGYFVLVDGPQLRLRLRPPGAAGGGALAGRILPLDDAFDPGHDFVQDVQLAAGGTAVLTRWSGRIHLVDRRGKVRSVTLPAPAEAGLFYTAVLEDGRLCATHCGDVTVVCREL